MNKFFAAILSMSCSCLLTASSAAVADEPRPPTEKKVVSGKETTLRNLEEVLKRFNGVVAPAVRIFVDTWSRPIPRDHPPAQNNRIYFSDRECLDGRCGSSVGITIGER